MYFDSLGLLNLFPPDQIGELILALYDYAHRICEEEETPEEALFRYSLLEETTQVGFISMAGHILRDTRVWKQRQSHCRSSAAQRVQRQQAAMEQYHPAKKPEPLQETATPKSRNTAEPERPVITVREPDWNGTVTEKEMVDYLEDKEYLRMAERFPVLQELSSEEEQEAPPEVRRAYMEKIRKILNEANRPMDETPIEEIM